MPADKSMMVNFVLEKFSKPEIPAVRRMVHRAAEASVAFVEDGMSGAMNRFNGPPTEQTTT
jgi:peptidyl-tRNA hydrolase